MEWNDETIARLRLLWDEGLSTAEIGRRLGVSKNAVVGKAHRMMLPPRPSPIRRDGVASPRAATPRRVTGPTLPPLPASCLDQPARAHRIGARATPREDVVATAPTSPQMATGTATETAAVMKPVVRPSSEAAASATARMPPLTGMEHTPPMRVVPTMAGRHSSCCWPLGEPGTRSFRFCDATALTSKPYCAEHAQVAYVKVRDRREEAA